VNGNSLLCDSISAGVGGDDDDSARGKMVTDLLMDGG
jgi:hypothetical protein